MGAVNEQYEQYACSCIVSRVMNVSIWGRVSLCVVGERGDVLFLIHFAEFELKDGVGRVTDTALFCVCVCGEGGGLEIIISDSPHALYWIIAKTAKPKVFVDPISNPLNTRRIVCYARYTPSIIDCTHRSCCSCGSGT